ncbi:hypothetical protein ACFQVC_39495 [Streptomyces monticola]|uniref:Peptidase n=1 Tax=Streptomyces monticola TaxID=2666263 RepID=A0ABW2JVR8_9ACTN
MNHSRKVAGAAAALVAAGFLASAGTASADTGAGPERITSAAQLSASIQKAVALEQEYGDAEVAQCSRGVRTGEA